MKRIILLIALFCSLTFGQGWNNTVTTSINEPNVRAMEVFSNKDGNHFLIKRSNGNIVYYNFNSSGTVDNNKTTTLESNGDFPNIVGYNDKVFALYKAGNYIKGKYTTNGGSSWTSLPNISTTANDCNGVDATYESDYGVHLVYAARDNDPYFETYYYRLNTYNQWVDSKNVTDYGSEVGGVPSVTFSNNRIHVSYNSGEAYEYPYIGDGVSKTRDKVVSTNTWLDPQLVLDGTSREKLDVRGNKIFCFYYDFWADLGLGGWYIRVKSRDLTGSYWPASYTQLCFDSPPDELLGGGTTSNNNLNVIYEDVEGLEYIYYDGSNWSNAFYLGGNGYVQHEALSTASNDLFVSWKQYSSDYIKYRQYDANPLTPSNFSGTTYNNHPKIMWSANSEPDLNYYEIWRQIIIDPKNPGSWTLVTTTTSTNFVDNDIVIGNGSSGSAVYKIRAKDVNSHLSSYTGILSFDFEALQKRSYSSTSEIKEFAVTQNYPNPFNPTTKISYTLPENAMVQIKVYNVLGTEVAELVNETQTSGYYETTFDASNLSSGVYIYRITALSKNKVLFSQSKQMLLLK